MADSGAPSTAAASTSRSTWRVPTWRTDAACCRPATSGRRPAAGARLGGVHERGAVRLGGARRAAAVQAVNTRCRGGLTPTEREFVAVVLQRHTIAEIARQLFMSKRTIELHLTRVFRKVGVARKSQLIELDAVRELVGPPSAR